MSIGIGASIRRRVLRHVWSLCAPHLAPRTTPKPGPPARQTAAFFWEKTAPLSGLGFRTRGHREYT